EERGALGGVRGFVRDGPEHDGRTIPVARNLLMQLALCFCKHCGIAKVLGPIDRNLGPDEQAHLIGESGHSLIVRIMRKSDEVTAEFACPSEQCFCILVIVGAASANGSFAMDRDTA